MSSTPFAVPLLYGISQKGKLNNIPQNTMFGVALDQLTAQLVSQAGMPYGFLTLGGVMSTGTWPAAAFAAASATALSAFALYNPAGSGVNAHMANVTVTVTAFTAQAAASAVGIAPFTQTPTSVTTTGTAKANCLIGQGSAPQCIQYVTGTTVGAVTVPIRNLCSFYTDLVAGDMVSYSSTDLAGSIIIPPGSGIQLIAVGGTVADLTASVSMTWAEIAQ
jgi:hypothetical protein